MAEHSSGEPIAIQRVSPLQPGRLALVSEAIGEDGRIGEAYSGYDENHSPPLVWTGMPDAETFALIVEDPDAPMDRPVLHWAVWNIPGTLKGLPSAIRPEPRIEEYGGMIQGRNYIGQHGYAGPRPPPGDGPHRYHFQLFALGQRLTLDADAPFEALIDVLKANALASCELVGLFERPDEAGAPLEARSFSQAEINAGRAGLDEDDVDRHALHDKEGVVRRD